MSIKSSSSSTSFKVPTEDGEHTLTAFGDVAASEINFMRSSSPDVIEPPKRPNRNRTIKRPLPPSKSASRRKAYGNLDDFTALYNSLREGRDQARASSDRVKSDSFEQQLSWALSSEQVASYSGRPTGIRNSNQARNTTPLTSSDHDYSLPGPLRHKMERLPRRQPLPRWNLYLEQDDSKEGVAKAE
ncbi:hypothetical protein BT96DRAFT_983940 [Gymnopus androsaceus JB14]|uniref:Uncharacterized protein n=1 Tax=Gymnopus androsaceus JB14 TaxID=1447944 RepID=A0A6A4ILI8_9AGAR|nr:hypothetical protein BT96DRAFT_983940 [Gymnopus androsaceus JB14]